MSSYHSISLGKVNMFTLDNTPTVVYINKDKLFNNIIYIVYRYISIHTNHLT